MTTSPGSHDQHTNDQNRFHAFLTLHGLMRKGIRVSPQDIVNRLLDHLEESKRLFAESRSAVPKNTGDLIDILHDCEQLTQNQIRLLNRALRRL